MRERSEGAVGVFTTDRELVVRSWDAWMALATGIAEGDATGRPLAALFPEIAERGLLERLRRVASGGGVEVLAPAFHAGLIPCAPRTPSRHFTRMQQHVTVAPLRAGDDAPIGLVVTVEDVTARRDAERDLAIALASDDDAVRLHAARTLADTGTHPASPLVGVLGDRSWRVRRVAAEGLARRGDEETRDALVAALRERHRDPAVLNATLSALVRAEQDVLSPLLESLADDDVELRTYAALALGLLEDPRAVEPLVHALNDADSNVRFHAIEALGRIRSRAAALPIAAVAESRDFDVAFAALDALTAIGEPSVAPSIVALLDDDLLRTAAAEALGRLGGEDVVAPLAMQLDRSADSAAVVATALTTLAGRIDGTSDDASGGAVADLARAVLTAGATHNLTAALERAREDEVAGLAIVLGWLRPDGVEHALVGALANERARGAVVSALAASGTRAVEPLLAALESDSVDTRVAAAATLGRMGATAAVPALVARLEDEPVVAVVAASALGGIGDVRAFEPLLARLGDPHSAMRQAAVGAISSLGHPELVQRVERLAGDPSPHVRESVARLAGYAGDPACLAPLLAMSDDADESVRRAAIEQLAQFHDDRALAAIHAALGAEASGVRAAAVRALAQVAWQQAQAPLLDAASDRDPWVRYYAARALGHHRHPDAVPTLVALATSDPIPPVRIAAVDALADVGVADGLVRLAPLADDPDPTIARQVLLALGGVDDPAATEALVRALHSDDRACRLAALGALERSESGMVVDAAAPLAVAGGDAEVQSLALRVLAHVGGRAAVEALLTIASDPQRAPELVEALATLGERDVAWLGLGLAGDDAAVRCIVVEALGRMSHAAVSPLLASALHHGDQATRTAAAYALGRRDLRMARIAGTRSAGG